jgi:beta-glucosidase-like glycosyl hydrolase
LALLLQRYLLTDVLKRAWGYQGYVMSDWGAVRGSSPFADPTEQLPQLLS